MTSHALIVGLSAEDEAALAFAVKTLETTNLAARLADYAGEPITKAIRLLPGFVTRRIDRTVERAVVQGLAIAIETLDDEPLGRPAVRRSTVIAGVTGGVGGAFGLIALPIELPFTTTVILRAIADIARHQGEDLSRIEARLACLEVFALSAKGGKARTDFGYFAARALLSKLTADAAAFVLERGVAGAATPVIGNLVAAIAARFGAVVSDRIAASAVPVIGAVGGAAINVVFMNHFQAIALAHFSVRRLEREYGFEAARAHYDRLASTMVKPAVSTRRLARARQALAEA